MRLLVCGGAGFIGSNFVRLRLADGDEVTVLDKLTYSGRRVNLEGLASKITCPLQIVHGGLDPITPTDNATRLQAEATELLPRGITGHEIAELEEGWATLHEEEPDPARVTERGARLFGIAAKLLGSQHEMLGAAGRLYAGVDVARRGLWNPVKGVIGLGGQRFPLRLRPLTAWAALAARDLRRGGPPFESEATPGRAAALLFHRLFGTVA